MGSIDDISELCRLCLVKDQVNIPIFDETSDIRQTFLKINSCLPVKVSRDDNLPKKICDGCSYKLDMLYIFRNTSVDSEKQLISWLNQAGLSSCALSQSAAKDPLANAKPEIMVKQETFETTESRVEGDSPEMGVDAHSYIIQQQKLPYPQEFAFAEASGSTAGLMNEEPAPKRAKRAAAMKKPPLETEEDDLDVAMQITKAEDEDSDDADQPDYVEAPSTSADDQPGPSGVGKGTIEAPLDPLQIDDPQLGVRICCPACPKTFTTKQKYWSHRKTHKGNTVQCTLCPKSFHSKSYLKIHLGTVHEKLRNFSCTLCTYAAGTKSCLQSHMIRSHTKDYRYRCDLCNMGYQLKDKLDQHRRAKHEGKCFICEICKKIYRDEVYFNQHMQRHDPNYIRKVYTCKVCRKVMHWHTQFKDHMKTHDRAADRHICDICGKVLVSKAGLRKHMNRHANKRNSVCDTCGKAFIDNMTLVQHIRVHTKEKPYKCSFCEKCFTQRSSLNIHVRLHTGEKPYKCKICSREFISKNLLNSHKCFVTS
jgi:hypothetical protein